MRIKQFDYYTPASLDEACIMLSELPGGVTILAGGTDLLVDLKEETVRWDHLVSLKKIDELRKIEFDSNTGLTIGSAATLNTVARNELVLHWYPAIAEAAASVAGQQVRNRGTIGGNICSAVPSADVPPILLTLNCELKLINAEGERILPLDQFFKGPRKTVRRKEELLVSLHIPPPEKKSGSCYIKFSLRNASALAVVGVAAKVVMEGKKCVRGKIALGAVAPTPMIAERASRELVGIELNEQQARRIGSIAREECSPISDLRGSEEYRRELVEILTARALITAVERAIANT